MEPTLDFTEWFDRKGLDSYEMMFADQGMNIVFNEEIANGFMRYIIRMNLLEACNNNRIIACLVCGGPFIVSGGLCKCYQTVPDRHNFRCFISDELWIDVDNVFKKIKNGIKLRRLRKTRILLENEASGSYDTTDLEIIYKLQVGLCYYCMCPIYSSGAEKFTIDHLMPLSSGGSHWPANIALACKSCNSKKSWTSERFYIKKIRSVKSDEWVQEHKEFVSYIKRHKRKIFGPLCDE
ncbi:HNH endonuclease [Citrifermentans bremense]|nr:HNH endonuclease signature motif containing protein [Citrifermentans bremense]